MKIDIPMMLCFDTQSLASPYHAPKHLVTFTWRIDKDDSNDFGECCIGYPPTAASHWFPGNSAGPAEFLTSRIWSRIQADAEKSPVDYASDPAEGERLQVIADAEREPI